MRRCIYCYGLVSDDEKCCAICGSKVPKYAKTVLKDRVVSFATHFIFLASLGYTVYCYMVERSLALPATLTIASALLLIRVLAEEFANR